MSAAGTTPPAMPDAGPLAIRSLFALAFRHPLAMPVVTSFGVMRDRPMVLVRAEDGDGVVGWGEAWCNFPSVGAEHRVRIVNEILAPLVVQRTFAGPAEAYDVLTARTEILALQSGEPGPFAQAIAGVDIALWDIAARRAGLPLWRFLGGRSPTIAVYASGLNPDAPARLAEAKRNEGHRAFKLKIGFGRERDLANLRDLRAVLGDAAMLMVDANQALSLEAAVDLAHALEPFAVDWLEEPLRADRPWSDWTTLCNATTIPLAAGENIAGDAAFDAALAAGALAVVQPDMAKWGGVSRSVPLARRVLAHGRRFCPHYLGGGVGLLASAHGLAAVGGQGMLEIDANPNPLRSATCGSVEAVVGGKATLGDGPGLGVDPDLGYLRRYAVPASPAA